MPYARFDDRYDDHRKIRQALRREPAAVSLHAMAITYCSRHVTDGIVDGSWVDATLSLTGYRAAKKRAVLKTLLDLQLFERIDDDTFRLHGFLDWNLSREQRRSLAEQGRKGGRAHAGSSEPNGDDAGPGSSQGPSHRPSQGLSGGLSPSESGGLSTPTPTPTPTPTEKNNNTLPSLRSDVVEIFGYWQEKCNHPAAKLSADRRSKIEARRREGYSVADLRQAVDGAARAPYIDGKGKRFDDIALICREGSKVEDFQERATRGPLHVVGAAGKSSPSDLLRKLNAAEAAS